MDNLEKKMFDIVNRNADTKELESRLTAISARRKRKPARKRGAKK